MKDALTTEKYDVARLYFGYDLTISDKIIIHQPTIGEIVEIGEQEYFSMLNMITATPYDYMSELWDTGVDFTKISDIEFFSTMSSHINPKFSFIFFGGTIDISKFQLFKKDGNVVLYDDESGVLIDDETFKKISSSLCMIHGIKKERFYPAGKRAKQEMINADRQEKETKKAQIKSELHHSVLLPLLSSVVNYEGFKYNLDETRNLKIFFFMDCVSRIKLKDIVAGLSVGWYTGSLDAKKFKPEKQLNWMKDLYNGL